MLSIETVDVGNTQESQIRTDFFSVNVYILNAILYHNIVANGSIMTFRRRVESCLLVPCIQSVEGANTHSFMLRYFSLNAACRRACMPPPQQQPLLCP